MKKQYLFVHEAVGNVYTTFMDVEVGMDYHTAMKYKPISGNLISIALKVHGTWHTIFANGVEVSVKLR